MILSALLMAAAIQTTTTCNQMGGQTMCHTTAPPPAPFEASRRARDAGSDNSPPPAPVPGASCNPVDLIMTGCQVGRARQAQRNAEAQRAAERQQSDLRQSVSRLIADGDCPGAVRAALAAGDIALAREARDFCEP